MCKKILLLLSAVLFVAAFCYATEQATNQPSAQQKEKGAPAQNSQMTGIVESIDLQKKTLTIKDEATNKNQEILFSETTTFQKQDSPAKVEDLKQGDRIMLEVDSTNTAVRINMEPKKEPSSEGEKQKK